MKPAATHAHPSNPECDVIVSCELEEGDHLAEGDVYAWGMYWWLTWFPAA